MTWQVLPIIVDPNQTYDFTWDSDAGQVIQALTTYAACLVGCCPHPLVLYCLSCFTKQSQCAIVMSADDMLFCRA